MQGRRSKKLVVKCLFLFFLCAVASLNAEPESISGDTVVVLNSSRLKGALPGRWLATPRMVDPEKLSKRLLDSEDPLTELSGC